jgi:high-affinity iron transporter
VCSCDLADRPGTNQASVPSVPHERLASPQARERGAALYRDNCVLCHGEQADGRGVRRWTLLPPPRDYSDPNWRRTATPRSVYLAIRDGVSGTAMPSWSTFSDEQTWDLVTYVLSVAEQGP